MKRKFLFAIKKGSVSDLIIPLFLFTLIFQFNLSSAQSVTIELGIRRDFNNDFLGYNAQNTIRDSMYLTEPHLVSNFPSLLPKIIRYPAGGISNWWNWQTGWFMTSDPNCPQSYKELEVKNNGLDSLKKVCDASGTIPRFVLNLISSSLKNELMMLETAAAKGLPVMYVELGNEFYLSDLEDSKVVDSIFPSGVEYGSFATIWIDSIHKHFPDCKVAAIGAFNRNNDDRRVNWDPEMYTTLKGEDAISFHAYYSSNAVGDLPPSELDTFKTEMVPDMLYRPSKVWSTLKDEDFSIMPSKDEIWITEYNLQDHNIPVHGSWAHGLYLSSLTLQFLNDTRVRHTATHAICGTAVYGMFFNVHNGFQFGGGDQFVNPVVPPDSTQYWGLTAGGRTMKTLGMALHGMSYASPLEFKNVPYTTTIDNKDTVTYPLAYGWVFTSDTATHVILFNYSDSVLKFKTKFVFPNGGTYKEYYADATQYIAFEGDVRSKSKSKIPGQYKSEAYSITYLRATTVLNPPPVVNMTADGPTTFCNGDSVKLSAGATYNEYLWSTGEKTKNIWVKTTGDYIVKCRSDKNGYWGVDTMHVTVLEVPEVKITLDGDKKICEGVETTNLIAKDCIGCYFQWYKNQILIPDSNDQILTVTYAGDYTYSATNSNGCSATSDIKTITAGGCRFENTNYENTSGEVNVYPNPAENSFHITAYSDQIFSEATIEIQNMIGETLLLDEVNSGTGFLDATLDISAIKNGIYMIVVKSKNYIKIMPLIICRQ